MTHTLREIELSDFQSFDGRFCAEDDPPCQLNFYQLFITREEMLIKTHIEEDLLFVLGWSSECDHALYGPPLPLTPDPEKLLSQLKECHRLLKWQGLNEDPQEGLYIVLLNERWAASFKDIGAQIFPTQDDDNYIYRTKDVANLTGNNLSLRRARIRAFEKKNGVLYSRELHRIPNCRRAKRDSRMACKQVEVFGI